MAAVASFVGGVAAAGELSSFLGVIVLPPACVSACAYACLCSLKKLWHCAVICVGGHNDVAARGNTHADDVVGYGENRKRSRKLGVRECPKKF